MFNDNPVIAIDIHMKDGAVLRLNMPNVRQARVMAALGRLAADLDVPLNITLPPGWVEVPRITWEEE